MSTNLTILSGRITKDPKLEVTRSQMPICRFNIALDRGKDKNGEDKGTDFPRVTVFGKQAENLACYITQGCRLMVIGRLQTGSYQDQDGKTVYTTDVIADRIDYIDFGDATRKQEPETEPELEPELPPPDSFKSIAEDVPF